MYQEFIYFQSGWFTASPQGTREYTGKSEVERWTEPFLELMHKCVCLGSGGKESVLCLHVVYLMRPLFKGGEVLRSFPSLHMSQCLIRVSKTIGSCEKKKYVQRANFRKLEGKQLWLSKQQIASSPPPPKPLKLTPNRNENPSGSTKQSGRHSQGPDGSLVDWKCATTCPGANSSLRADLEHTVNDHTGQKVGILRWKKRKKYHSDHGCYQQRGEECLSSSQMR